MFNEYQQQNWDEQRYLDALFDDHEQGHPNRETPVTTCVFCDLQTEVLDID